MTKEVDVVYVIADDWEGVYFDGKLVTEGHSISIPEIIDLLEGNVLKNYKVVEADLDWMNVMGSLPDDYKEVMIVQ